MKDYRFDGSISLEVLNNYLDRAVTYTGHFMPTLYSDTDQKNIDEAILFITNVGAKYIQRAGGEWHPSVVPLNNFDTIKANISSAHEIDPDIIFESCIFEVVTSAVNEIPIPAYVFEAFEMEPEKRNFNMDGMAFSDGYKGNFDPGTIVPDVTKTETQMFIYYRACLFIDMGFEALHLGQVLLTGRAEPNNETYTKVIGMIREYAKKHARRHYVLINAHNNEFTAPDGTMLVDMIVAPIRPAPADDETDHEVSEENPQRCVLKANYWKSVYQSGISGTSPSGWYAERYPYLVEFDNYGGKLGDTSKKDSYVWGLDEISWYASQPQWYRREFMQYAIDKINSFEENGHVAFVGYRGGQYNSMLGEKQQYYANGSDFCKLGQNDEEFIKAILNSGT